jgi:hypothetical protein
MLPDERRRRTTPVPGKILERRDGAKAPAFEPMQAAGSSAYTLRKNDGDFRQPAPWCRMCSTTPRAFALLFDGVVADASSGRCTSK